MRFGRSTGGIGLVARRHCVAGPGISGDWAGDVLVVREGADMAGMLGRVGMAGTLEVGRSGMTIATGMLGVTVTATVTETVGAGMAGMTLRGIRAVWAPTGRSRVSPSLDSVTP